MISKALVMLLSGLLAVSVGAANASSSGSMKDTRKKTEAANVEAQRLLTISRNEQSAEPYYSESVELWVGGNTISTTKQTTLPAVFSNQLIFRRQWPVTLNDIAEYLSSNYDIQVAVTEDANKAAKETARDPVEVLQRRQMMLQQSQGGGGQSSAPQGGQAGSNDQGAFVIQYEGTVKGFLNLVASRSGNHWRFEDGRVVLANLETRMFQLQIQPGSQTVTASVSADVEGGGDEGGGGGGESGGGASGGSSKASASNATTMEMQLDRYTGTTESIKGMLSPKGKMVSTPALGQIMVTDVPAVLDRVEMVIKKMNDIATKQVAIDVKVYAVDVTSNRGFGIDWNLVWGSLGSNVSVGGGSGSSSGGTSSLGISVVNPASPFNGSSLIVDALARQGNVSEVTSVNLTTLSGSAVPFQVAEQTGYLKSSSTVLVPNAGSQTNNTAGTVTTGFSVVLVPTITEQNDVLMQVQLNISNLREIRKITSGNTTIETPLVGTRQVLQRVKLDNGQTLVLSGFEQEGLRSDARGLGSPGFWLLGGGKNANSARTTLVVVITPRVI